MSSTLLQRVLTVIVLLAMCAACAPQAAPGLPSAMPIVPPAASPTPGTVEISPAFNLILGRPTASTITASLFSSTPQQIVLSYGTQSGKYSLQTNPVSLQADVPQAIQITALSPNTTYYYTILVNGTPSGEHSFHTQRAPGSSFTFTIDADPHNRDPNFNGKQYAVTLTSALHDQPDFHINLGDTFMTEKVQPQTYAEAASTFTDMRPYFGILGADVPLFLVNGNHEGELGWMLRGKTKDLPIWSTQLRQLYYPNPVPNDFYSGGASTDPSLGSVRDAYYAWTWGDALFVILDPFWYTTDKPKQGAPDTNWSWTLGPEQYDWLKTTLEKSTAKYKFVFTHHLVGGAQDARGGIEFANLYEWGGNNQDGSYGFDEHRPGWGKPIHQLLVENHVSAVFHGHDHVFVKQDLDGIVYQEVPQPSITEYNNTHLAADYGYVHGTVLSSSGHMRVSVSPDGVKVDYVRSYLDRPDEVAFTYTIQ
jgi:hypothetical protein